MPDDSWVAKNTAAQDEPWYRNQFLKDYREHGARNPAWDGTMEKLLMELARTRAREDESPSGKLIKLLNKTESAGCNDPFFRYLCARYEPWRGEFKRKSVDYVAAHLALRESAYGPLLRFYAAFRAAMLLQQRQPNSRAATQTFGLAIVNLLDALREPGMLAREVERATLPLVEELEKLEDKTWLLNGCREIVPILERQWPEDPDVQRARGAVHITLAWSARGWGFAATVTSRGWRVFGEQLAQAEQVLESSWKISPHPKTANAMLTVELGQGRERQRMETWFARAMHLDPANYIACRRKLWYLMPRWHGSREELLKFGMECLENPAWRGRVPLGAVDALENIALDLPKDKLDAFWESPQVWGVVKRAYERYFALNPSDRNTRKSYMRDAYRSKAWDTFEKQLNKLGGVDVAFFGGEAAVKRMLDEFASYKNRFVSDEEE